MVSAGQDGHPDLAGSGAAGCSTRGAREQRRPGTGSTMARLCPNDSGRLLARSQDLRPPVVSFRSCIPRTATKVSAPPRSPMAGSRPVSALVQRPRDGQRHA